MAAHLRVYRSQLPWQVHGPLRYSTACPNLGLRRHLRPLTSLPPQSTESAEPASRSALTSPALWNWTPHRQQQIYHRTVAAEREYRKPWQFWISSQPDPAERARAWLTSPPPHTLPTLAGVPLASAACGLSHCGVVTQEGQVLMWGNNSYGQVGPVKAATSWGSEDDEDVVVPYHMTDLARFEVDKLACGAFHNMALTSDGQLWTWGAGALGRGDEVYDSFPFPVHYFDDIQRTVTDIHASGDYSVAVTRATATSDDPSTVTEAETAGPHEVYIWGYMPTSSLRPEAKATSPALVKSLVGSRIHRLHCAPHFFSVLHSQPDEPQRPFLSVFGALKPPPTPSSSPEHVGAASEGSDHQHELAAYPTYLDHLPDARGVYDTEPALVRHLADLPFEVTDVRRMAGTWGMQVFTLYDGRVFIMDYETLRYRPLVRDPTQDIEACGSGGMPRYRDVAVGACQVTVLDEQGRLFAWQDLDDPQRLVDKVRKEPATLLGQDSGWRRLAAQTDQFIVY